MTIINFSKPLLFPPQPEKWASNNSFNSVALQNGTAEQVAFVFQAPKTGTIDKLGFRVGTMSTGTSTCDVRLETLNTTTGDPTGTLAGTNSNGNVNINSANTFYEVSLTAGVSVTRGDWLALVIAPSGTYNFQVSTYNGGGGGFPIPMRLTTSWGVSSTGALFVVGYSDGTYPDMMFNNPYSATSNEAFNSNSTPNNRGMRFTMPFNCKCEGIWAWTDQDANCYFTLYESDGFTIKKEMLHFTNTPKSGNAFLTSGLFDAKVDLIKDQSYFAVIRPATTSNVGLQRANYSNGDYRPFSWITGATSKDPTEVADWTIDNTLYYFCGLVISDIEFTGGGGGSNSISFI
jgi:hypothetical protein